MGVVECTVGDAASDGGRWYAGGGLSSSVICAYYTYIRAWTVVHCFPLALVERVSFCFELDGHCRLAVVYRMCCRRLGVDSGASGTVVDIRLG
jgi:hypothetical protein